jgi:hypothetical protein
LFDHKPPSKTFKDGPINHNLEDLSLKLMHYRALKNQLALKNRNKAAEILQIIFILG